MSYAFTQIERTVLELSRLIVNEKLSYVQAIECAGVPWSEKTFGVYIRSLLTNPATRGIVGSATRQMLQTAARTIGGQALAASGVAGSAGGGGVAAFLGLSASAWLFLLVGIAAVGVGGYVYARGDKPVQPGPAMQGEHRRQVAPVPEGSGKPSEPYGVFVGGGYQEVIVGQLSVIRETPCASLVGWGLDATKRVKDTDAQFTLVAGPFPTSAEARRAYEENKAPDSERIKPLATGTCARFKFDGKEHDIDNALRLLH